VIRLALCKPHRRDFPVQRFAAAFSEGCRAHQTSRNAFPAGTDKKQNERAWRTHSKQPLIFKNSASYSPATSLEFSQRRFPTDSRQGVSRNTFPVIPDFSVVSFSPWGAKRW
jgi:hypothetical protein